MTRDPRAAADRLLIVLLLVLAALASLPGHRAAAAAAGSGPAGSPAAEPAVTAQRPPGSAAWGWPVRGTPTVLRPFTSPRRYGAGHYGVDLAAASGDAVLSAGAGTVTFAGPVAGRPVVVVSHGSLRTSYEPVRRSVQVGSRVAAGQQLGTVEGGHRSCAPATCLHWGLRRGEDYLDPLSLLRPVRVRLFTPDAGYRPGPTDRVRPPARPAGRGPGPW